MPSARSKLFASYSSNDSRVRLYCLPFAGAGRAVFSQWQKELGGSIKVCPVLLPGREDKVNEHPYEESATLVTDAVEELSWSGISHYALFGHSMGGILAFEIACGLAARGYHPCCLFVSATPAPSALGPRAMGHLLPREEFLAHVQKLNGMQAELLNPDFLPLLLPALRADFRIVETYQYRAQAPLECDIIVFGGEDDVTVSEKGLHDWSNHTRGRCEVRIVPGDHFSVVRSRYLLTNAIRQRIADIFPYGA